MIKIKFNDSDIFHEVEFSRTENTVTLKGITEQNSSGFTTYRMSGEQLGDFSDFTTVFKVENDSITYSNDGSVYVEPIQPTEEEVNEEISKMAEAYKMEADKLKELLGERELEQMKKDMAVQKAVTVIADAAKEV